MFDPLEFFPSTNRQPAEPEPETPSEVWKKYAVEKPIDEGVGKVLDKSPPLKTLNKFKDVTEDITDVVNELGEMFRPYGTGAVEGCPKCAPKNFDVEIHEDLKDMTDALIDAFVERNPLKAGKLAVLYFTTLIRAGITAAAVSHKHKMDYLTKPHGFELEVSKEIGPAYPPGEGPPSIPNTEPKPSNPVEPSQGPNDPSNAQKVKDGMLLI